MKRGWILFLVLLITSTGMSCTNETNHEEETFFRIVEIPKREHGYSNFESMVITSQIKLDNFLEEISFQENLESIIF